MQILGAATLHVKRGTTTNLKATYSLLSILMLAEELEREEEDLSIGEALVNFQDSYRYLMGL